MQMVSVLALNKLELKEMINTEIVENPVLEELEENVPLLDDVAERDAERERPAEEIVADAQREKTDPFEEIDFGSYFQEYLDPGFRSPNNFELIEKPSFENFLSQPSTLTDHLFWQLGSLILPPSLCEAAEYIIGNLDEDGYLAASEEELIDGYLREKAAGSDKSGARHAPSVADSADPVAVDLVASADIPAERSPAIQDKRERVRVVLRAAIKVVQHLDPVGVASHDLRDCLLAQIEAHRREYQLAEKRKRAHRNGNLHADSYSSENSVLSADPPAALNGNHSTDHELGHEPKLETPTEPKPSVEVDDRIAIFDTATRIVDKHLSLLQKRDLRELSKALSTTVEHAQQALEYIRTLDPRPGQRYNRSEARLIEPDVAFVKRDNQYFVVMNEDDLPTLRLNQGYRRMLKQEGTEREVKDYVKERYRSALQLIRNIEQRKNTILRTCEAIVRRQGDFLEHGVESIKPMMIKEVAEEIGVHPSTVSRAVSNKYVHTSQGVYELRFFFSEGVNGPEGAGTPLMLLKRKVKKLIEEEDARKPLTDDKIAHMLQTQGIDVTRRTVAKYREDLRIPSTHQRRVRD